MVGGDELAESHVQGHGRKTGFAAPFELRQKRLVERAQRHAGMVVPYDRGAEHLPHAPIDRRLGHSPCGLHAGSSIGERFSRTYSTV